MSYIDQFLAVIVAEDASDLHIGEGQPPKMRRHGDVMPIRDESVAHEEAAKMLSEVCGQQRWEIFESGAISISLTRWMSSRVFAATS
jgi:twitching motility protein PilT